MPRSQKLVAALGLAIVAYLVSIQVLPQLPEGGQYTGLTLSNMVIGLIVGWIVMGNRSPSRVVTPLTNAQVNLTDCKLPHHSTVFVFKDVTVIHVGFHAAQPPFG